MASLHSDLPRHAGERDLADRLLQFCEPRLHLWFSIDYLPGVGDIDLLLWHEGIGVFLVEVKAIPMSAIDEMDFKRITIAKRRPSSSPHYQAYHTEVGLREYLEARGTGRRPYVVPTAWFPKITRAEWTAAVSDERLQHDFAERLLFADDLQSPAALCHRLTTIWSRPPIGRGGWRFSHDREQFEWFSAQIGVRGQSEAVQSDRRRIAVLERPHREAADKNAPVDERVRLLYTGYPGTGKTFRLLRIGIQHALAGKRVLFLCFNKVLAADARRLISLSRARDKFEAHDFFGLLNQVRCFHGIAPPDRSTFDEWADSLVRALGDNLPLAFDTVLIDEAQDLKPWAIEFITRLRRDDASIVAAASKGQELYGRTKETLSLLDLKQKDLHRVFRNSRAIFRFAQTFYETRLYHEKLDRVVRRFGTENEQLSFEGDLGSLPEIVEFEDARDARHPDYAPQLSRLIVRALDRIRERGGAPHDLLILVPGENYHEYDRALEALRLADVAYLDLVDRRTRRNIAPPSLVRLCTFHSARGIEATYQIVLGLTSLGSAAKQTTPENLAYVALSRATTSSELVFTASEMTHPVATFAVRARDRLREREQ